MNSPRRSRRQFLKTGCITAASAAMLPYLHADTPKKKLFSAIGSSAPLEKAAMIKAAGGEFITESVSSFLIPDQDEAAFEKNLEKLKASPIPILACNGFLRPTHLRCVGADANHDQVLAWADIAFRRLKRADGKIIVFGSSGARQLRDGWPKEKANEQFVALLKQMGPLAEAQGITVTVEQLHAKECNYINRIGEAATLVRAAGHPNIRVLADLYHMAVMDDTPEDLKAALDVVHHLEIAEKADRTMPGVAGDDFRPFFRVLRVSTPAPSPVSFRFSPSINSSLKSHCLHLYIPVSLSSANTYEKLRSAFAFFRKSRGRPANGSAGVERHQRPQNRSPRIIRDFNNGNP